MGTSADGLAPGVDGIVAMSDGDVADLGDSTDQSGPVDPSAYFLPWQCGLKFPCTEGNNDTTCGSPGGGNVGLQQYAFDFGMPRHTAVLASRSGVVTTVESVVKPGDDCYDGCAASDFAACCKRCLKKSNRINIAHGDGTVSTYLALDSITAVLGATVSVGQQIGYSGNSGCSSGPHLQFQVMGNCPTGFCQSVPVSFSEAGVPKCGDQATSANSCHH